jgi:hypothetical protein
MLTSLIIFIGSFYSLWIFFLAIMSLKKPYETNELPKHVLILAYPIIIVGIVLDIAINYTFMTIIMLEVPKEKTVSERLHRHNVNSVGYRKFITNLFIPFLNTFDKNHI